jgi:ABC-2 type transport system permease protein
MTRGHRFLLRIGALAGKETIHIRRDPRTLALALAMPVMLLMLFGYGVSFDMDRIPVAVVDLDHTATSRALVRHLYASNELIPPTSGIGGPDGTPRTTEEATELLRVGRAIGVLTIPQGTERDLATGTRLQLIVDGRDGITANQLLAKSQVIVRGASAELTGLTGKPPLEAKVWTRFNPEARSPLFLVPGMAAYLMAIAAVMLTALAIATEWERGSMEQLFASPVGRLEIIFGKLLPYLVIGVLQLLLVLAVGAWVFDVPIRGSVVLLFSAGLIFLLGMLGQGLLISVVTKNQLVATQAGALTSLLPSMLLSGLMFPIENMPKVLQWISMVIPARHMVHALRGIMLKGAGLHDLWPDLVAMAVFAVFVIAAATARFQRRLA